MNIIIDEKNIKLSKKISETNKKIYNRIDENRSINLADFSDYKTIDNKVKDLDLFCIKLIFSQNLLAAFL